MEVFSTKDINFIFRKPMACIDFIFMLRKNQITNLRPSVDLIYKGKFLHVENPQFLINSSCARGELPASLGRPPQSSYGGLVGKLKYRRVDFLRMDKHFIFIASRTEVRAARRPL